MNKILLVIQMILSLALLIMYFLNIKKSVKNILSVIVLILFYVNFFVFGGVK
jgi:lipopolysaccharide export LptBFGC system permease protein LptF